jgi:hypothetical protein
MRSCRSRRGVRDARQTIGEDVKACRLVPGLIQNSISWLFPVNAEIPVLLGAEYILAREIGADLGEKFDRHREFDPA